MRLILAKEELPLVTAICHTILLHERKLVPTVMIKRILDQHALPYQWVNCRRHVLTELEIVELWYRRRD